MDFIQLLIFPIVFILLSLMQRHNGMAAPAGGKAICVRFVLRGSFCRAWRAYFFHQSA